MGVCLGRRSQCPTEGGRCQNLRQMVTVKPFQMREDSRTAKEMSDESECGCCIGDVCSVGLVWWTGVDLASGSLGRSRCSNKQLEMETLGST